MVLCIANLDLWILNATLNALLQCCFMSAQICCTHHSCWVQPLEGFVRDSDSECEPAGLHSVPLRRCLRACRAACSW